MSSFLARQKLLVIGLAVGSLFITHADLIWNYVLGSTDTRVYRERDGKRRFDSITLANQSSEKSRTIVVRVPVPAEDILDFEWAPSTGAPTVSFLRGAEMTDSMRRVARTQARPLLQVIDRHSPPTSLYALDYALEDGFEAQERKKKILLDGFNHRVSVGSCDAVDSSSNCVAERDFEMWEQDALFVQQEAEAKWVRSTGVGLNFEGGYLCPGTELVFVAALDPGAEGIITVHYGPRQLPGNTVPKIESAQNVTFLYSADDVDASRWWIAWRYHPVRAGLSIIALIAIATLAKPVRSMPTYRMVNKALKAGAPDEDELWEIIFSRTRFMLLDAFRGYAATFGKVTVVPTEDLCVYVRDRLRVRYASDRKMFTDGREMKAEMRDCMWQVALNA